MNRLSLLLIYIPVYILALVLGGCGGASEEVANVRPVQYTIVQSSATQSLRTFSGQVEAGYEATLSFKVAGTLEDRPVNVGDAVASGALLARLDNRDYQILVDQAQAALDLAQAQYLNAKADYERTKSLYENRNAAKNDLDAARASSESRRAQVESAQAQLAAAQLQLSYTEIMSPDACNVAEVYFEKNENIGAGQPVVRVNCGDCPQVTVSVPDTIITQIKPNDSVSVRTPALPGEVFEAIVTEVGVATGVRSATYPVRVVLTGDCAHALLRSGMAADVEFNFNLSPAAEHTIIVPIVAVNEDKEGTFVFVLTPDPDRPEYYIAQRRTVSVGEMTRLGLVVKEGLAPGEYIATAGVKQLNDQALVTLLNVKE
ncbi:MAG TPA: efflux RND transporter periplasmic adaptor subunit [Gammaproteobacteria bacterium]|nr:efflux RND transporter periplasmic adaptor subunit [Gammaproteobacteria bacterium]